MFVCDPMLATGCSMEAAIDALLTRGVQLHQLLVLVLIACEEGLKRLFTRWPSLRVACQWVDDGLNEHSYIVPGIGDAGDRYHGT